MRGGSESLRTARLENKDVKRLSRAETKVAASLVGCAAHVLPVRGLDTVHASFFVTCASPEGEDWSTCLACLARSIDPGPGLPPQRNSTSGSRSDKATRKLGDSVTSSCRPLCETLFCLSFDNGRGRFRVWFFV